MEIACSSRYPGHAGEAAINSDICLSTDPGGVQRQSMHRLLIFRNASDTVPYTVHFPDHARIGAKTFPVVLPASVTLFATRRNAFSNRRSITDATLSAA